MPRKSADIERQSERAKPGTDTSSFEQPQGTEHPRAAPQRRNAKLPHERDESAGEASDRLRETNTPSERQISQAHEDVEHGLKDTDRRGIPSDVPGSERNRES